MITTAWSMRYRILKAVVLVLSTILVYTYFFNHSQPDTNFTSTLPICLDLREGKTHKYVSNGPATNVSASVLSAMQTDTSSGLCYTSTWTSDEEKSYPIAYSISVYENVVQALSLLRLIYRPHNVYCIHLDAKMDGKAESLLTRSIEQCPASNVILLPRARRIRVEWGKMSVLESALVCAEALVNQDLVKWRYLVNVNEKELPLRTGWELVKALKAINGSNIVESFERIDDAKKLPQEILSRKISWIKGSFLTALRYEFVKFMFEDARAKTILSVLRNASRLPRLPDELYFSTLAYNPSLDVPGACLQVHKPNPTDPKSWHLARYVHWVDEGACLSGTSVHGICILGMNDVSRLVRRPELFANKFHLHHQPLAYQCMQEWLVEKMRNERLRGDTDPSFDLSLYSQTYCSQQHA